VNRARTRWRIAATLLAAVLSGCGEEPPGSVDVLPDPPDQPEPPLEHVGGAEIVLCDPVADVDEPHLLEGNVASLSFDCSGDVDRSLYVASVVTEAEGYEFNPQTWAVQWPTDLDDGGRWEFALTVALSGGTPPDQLPETAVATVWVADDLDHPDNVPVVPEDYTEEWGLPVVHLQPHGTLTQEHVATTITFMGRTYDAEMKIRGAASTYYPKNSYTLRFGDEDLDATALGLGNKDHLVLITSFDDNSYVRQKLAYDLWAAVAEYWGRERLSPRTSFVVVYFDREYWGLYTSCDRLDDHFAQEMGLSRDGNLYKSIDHDANFYRTDYWGAAKSTLHQGYTKEEGEPPEGEPGAFDDLDDLVAFVADSDHETFADEVDGWLRTDEFMDWFLFVHHTASDDSGGKNAYLYDDPEQPEFRYAPWDFNHSFGQGWYTYRVSSHSYEDFIWGNGIFWHFQVHPPLADELWGRYAAMRTDGPLHVTWFTTQLDTYYALVDRSAVRDWSVWGGEYLSYWESYSTSGNDNDYEQERAYLYDWLYQRDQWMAQCHP